MKKILLPLCSVVLVILLTSSLISAQSQTEKPNLTYDEVVKLRSEYIAKKQQAAQERVKNTTTLSLEERKTKTLKKLEAEENALEEKGLLTPDIRKAIEARKKKIETMK